MTWLILGVLFVVGFVFYRFTIRVLKETKVSKLRQNSILSNKPWQAIDYGKANFTAVNMMSGQVKVSSVYQNNFKLMFDRYVKFALTGDEKLDPSQTEILVNEDYGDPSTNEWLHFAKNDLSTRESRMLQSAVLYALICTQRKGANIKERIMNDDKYLQQKTNEEYLEYMNKNHPNFCQLVGILEPSKSNLIIIVAGYLLTK